MRLVSIVFVALLAWLHTTDPLSVTLGRPLSLFRDGAGSTAAMLLFGLLLLMGLAMIRRLWAARRTDDAIVFVLASATLLYVALTPSMAWDHILCSLILLALFYAYYLAWLHALRSTWTPAHLLVPIVLALVARGHGFGLWQKGLVLYYVLAINLQHRWILRMLAPPAPEAGPAGESAAAAARPAPHRYPARPPERPP